MPQTACRRRGSGWPTTTDVLEVTITRDGREVAKVPLMHLLSALGIPYSEELCEEIAEQMAEEQRIERLFASL